MANEANAEQQQTNGAQASRRRQHRRRIWIALATLASVAALVTCYWYLYLRGWVSTDDAYVDSDQITVSSKILGRVVELAVSEGDTVRQGQIVVFLDSTDLKALEAQAEASLQFVEQNVPVSRINLEKAQEDFKRAEIQFKGDVITHEQYDHSSRALDLARAQFNAASSQVAASQSQLGVLQTQLQNTKVVVQDAGVVARKWVVVGDIVQPGQPVYTVYDLSDVWITANFEETKLASIRIGESVEVAIDAFPGRKFTGRVELIGAAAASQFSLIPPNNASGNFTKVTQRVPVKVSLEGVDPNHGSSSGNLLPGMSATVRLRKMEQP